MAEKKVICTNKECFANKCGAICDILVDYVRQPCPFFKTKQENEEDKMIAHNRLYDMGREDLILKYEYNPQRKGQW